MLETFKGFIIYNYIKQLVSRFIAGDLVAMSAQITYYFLLAFFPFLLFLINLLSFTTISSELVITNVSAFLPQDTAFLVKNTLEQTVEAKSKTLLIVGMLGSLWVASRGIAAIIRALNNSYDVKETRNFFRLSFISLITTLGVTVMIIFAFVMIVFGKIIGSYVFGLIGATALFDIIWSVLRYAIPLSVMIITFSLIYTYVPNRKLRFKNVIIGTLFATVGWISTSLVFSFYVNNFANYEKVYGSLGGVIALIIWLNLSALIILVGGELNAINSNARKA